ncbi:hypothetical protein KZ829_00360 [Actinoplanes hulinensis]|uniref:Uncharacterized protein n=1 Tax=Actinoplanes hulinensis TaxID=1144547 RepID=A0ABS7ATR3_9ACTN|nr:hypothetical protein [Actinoplanes hulinensis]MBW6432198.1 hypothetical protein [Actinoplanes hulinensis]
MGKRRQQNRTPGTGSSVRTFIEPEEPHGCGSSSFRRVETARDVRIACNGCGRQDNYWRR